MNGQGLIDKYIEINPNRPGGANAQIRGFGVPVSALIGYLEAVHGDVARVADDYRLPKEAVEAALAYYRQHKPLIDARLEANAG